MSEKKTALITGAPGQDANWMSRLLLSKGYRVVCTYRYSSTALAERVREYIKGVEFVPLDISDPSGCRKVVEEVDPDYIINLGALSHVAQSFSNPYAVMSVNTIGVLNFLEILKDKPNIRFITASSSEQYGSNFSTDSKGIRYQDELTPFNGNSPYAIAKIAAHNFVSLYRASYNLFCCSSICHNHESKYRGEQFVTRKITKWLAGLANMGDLVSLTDTHLQFERGRVEKLRLGNIHAVRDWSHSLDFMRGILLMLEQDTPDDYLFASGVGRSVDDFLKAAFSHFNITDYMNYIIIDPAFYRPCEVPFLQGRATKAKEKLGWTPEITFNELVNEMVEEDIKRCTSL